MRVGVGVGLADVDSIVWEGTAWGPGVGEAEVTVGSGLGVGIGVKVAGGSSVGAKAATIDTPSWSGARKSGLLAYRTTATRATATTDKAAHRRRGRPRRRRGRPRPAPEDMCGDLGGGLCGGCRVGLGCWDGWRHGGRWPRP